MEYCFLFMALPVITFPPTCQTQYIYLFFLVLCWSSETLQSLKISWWGIQCWEFEGWAYTWSANSWSGITPLCFSSPGQTLSMPFWQKHTGDEMCHSPSDSSCALSQAVYNDQDAGRGQTGSTHFIECVLPWQGSERFLGACWLWPLLKELQPINVLLVSRWEIGIILFLCSVLKEMAEGDLPL